MTMQHLQLKKTDCAVRHSSKFAPVKQKAQAPIPRLRPAEQADQLNRQAVFSGSTEYQAKLAVFIKATVEKGPG